MTRRKQQQKTQRETFWGPLVRLRNNLNSKSPDKRMSAWLVIIAVFLPLIAWGSGVMLNPDGWMSDSPLIAYFFVVAYPVYYWPITLLATGVIVVILGVIRANAALTERILTALFFTISLVASVITFMAVRDASSSEFTG